jgi:hypothetical protein
MPLLARGPAEFARLPSDSSKAVVEKPRSSAGSR